MCFSPCVQSSTDRPPVPPYVGRNSRREIKTPIAHGQCSFPDGDHSFSMGRQSSTRSATAKKFQLRAKTVRLLSVPILPHPAPDKLQQGSASAQRAPGRLSHWPILHLSSIGDWLSSCSWHRLARLGSGSSSVELSLGFNQCDSQDTSTPPRTAL